MHRSRQKARKSVRYDYGWKSNSSLSVQVDSFIRKIDSFIRKTNS
jgi:hypothetical protein